MRKVKFQIKPTILLFPSRLDDVEKSNSEEGDTMPYSVQVRPASEFAYDSARSKLIALRIGEENGPVVNVPTDMHNVAGENQMRGNLLRLVAWINMDSRITVGCAGAVLSCLQRKRAVGMDGDDVNERLQIGSIEMFSMADVMCVDLFL
jgi:DNA mismatch repair protein MSH5